MNFKTFNSFWDFTICISLLYLKFENLVWDLIPSSTLCPFRDFKKLIIFGIQTIPFCLEKKYMIENEGGFISKSSNYEIYRKQ